MTCRTKSFYPFTRPFIGREMIDRAKAFCSRWSAGASFFVVAVLASAEAHAGGRVLLLELSGRKADVLQDKVVQSLQQGGYKVELSETSSHGISKARVARLGRGAGVDAVIEGDVRRLGMKTWSVVLRVHDPRTGRRLGHEIRFKNSWLPGLASDLLEQTSARVDAALDRKHGGSSAEPLDEPEDREGTEAPDPTPAEEEPAAASPAPRSAPKAVAAPDPDDTALPEAPADESELDQGTAEGSQHKGRGMVAQLQARGGMVHHVLSFSDDLYKRLRKEGTNTWVYRVEGELYPFDQPVGDHLGLIASYEGSISGSVKDDDFGGSFPVIYREFYVGGRARYPIGAHQIGFDLTFGQMHSALDDPTHRSNIPGVSYTLLRSSLDADFDLGALHALASLGFRLPLGFGEVATAQWFPHVGGYGVEASGGFYYPFSKHVSIDLVATLRRYLLEMNSVPQDAMTGVSEVAGGAVDLYTSGYIGMTFRL
jgi:hypothetical protein